MLDLETAKMVFNDLSVGYRKVESRMEIGKSTHTHISSDVCCHAIGYDIPKEYHNKVPLYNDINPRTKQIIQPYLDKAEEIIRSESKSVGQKLIIMSSDWCGSSRHVKHLHTLQQGDKCNTLSITIPLYIDENCDTAHGFHWHYQPELYPKITYTSSVRMERIDRNYTKADIPKNDFSMLKFDGSRAIHYIDNTPHLYLWVVCDAVEFLSDEPLVGLTVKSYTSK